VENELFGIALGIQDPIFIDEIAFDSASGELHIHMDFRRGVTLPPIIAPISKLVIV